MKLSLYLLCFLSFAVVQYASAQGRGRGRPGRPTTRRRHPHLPTDRPPRPGEEIAIGFEPRPKEEDRPRRGHGRPQRLPRPDEPIGRRDSQRAQRRYIVKFRRGVEKGLIEDDLQDSKRQGKKVKNMKKLKFSFLKGDMTPRQLNALRRKRGVEYVIEDREVSISCQSHFLHSDAEGVDKLDGERNNQLSSGVNASSTNPTHIYVIDTGVRQDHVEFQRPDGSSRVVNFKQYWFESWMHPHGTAVAGIAAGSTRGVDPTAIIKAIRAMDNYGFGFYSDIIESIDDIIADHNSRGETAKSIINMSLGGGAYQPIDDAVQDAYDAGIVTVTASGNWGINADDISPCRSDKAVCVGAVDETNTLVWWSNFGSKVDIHAPGMLISSAGANTATEYVTFSGTSFSAPHVTGALSAFLSSSNGQNPSLCQCYNYLKSNAINEVNFTGVTWTLPAAATVAMGRGCAGSPPATVGTPLTTRRILRVQPC